MKMYKKKMAKKIKYGSYQKHCAIIIIIIIIIVQMPNNVKPSLVYGGDIGICSIWLRNISTNNVQRHQGAYHPI